jgi:hypothetical protein
VCWFCGMLTKCYFLPKLKKLVQVGIPKSYRVSVSSPSNSSPCVHVHVLVIGQVKDPSSAPAPKNNMFHSISREKFVSLQLSAWTTTLSPHSFRFVLVRRRPATAAAAAAAATAAVGKLVHRGTSSASMSITCTAVRLLLTLFSKG